VILTNAAGILLMRVRILYHLKPGSMAKTADEIRQLNEKISYAGRFVDTLRAEVGKVIVGQSYMLDRLLIGLLSNGHVLLEGVPGLAKTLTIKSLSQAIQAKFSRIQFTPDLLPADVIGTLIYNQQKGEFVIRKGPIFGNFILADEINRAPAKVQSALLEAMQERQVTIGESTFQLDEPFLVLATQNPLEQEGTYPLPEAQVDRFLMKVVVGYPSRQEEQLIVRQAVEGLSMPTINPVVSMQEILAARALVREVYMDEKVEQYILDIVFATRFPEDAGLGNLKPLVSYGSSPRGSINLAIAAKAQAFLSGRGYVIPEDVRSICIDVLRHRIGITYEAEAENVTAESVIEQILGKIALP
jgi:MoxR-like ATPase